MAGLDGDQASQKAFSDSQSQLSRHCHPRAAAPQDSHTADPVMYQS